MEVWADAVETPVAVRYAWSNNPVCNLYGKTGSVTLPATPFALVDHWSQENKIHKRKNPPEREDLSQACFFSVAALAFLWAKPSLEVILNSSQTTNPFGLAFDGKGNTYVAEYKGGRILLLDSDGEPRIFSGNGKKALPEMVLRHRKPSTTGFTIWPITQWRPLCLGYAEQPDPKDR